MKCRYTERNMTKRKCDDYYELHCSNAGIYCRVVEWKQKIGRCPYDKNIFSKNQAARKKEQRTLTGQKTL